MTRAHDNSLVRQRREQQGMLVIELARKLGRNAAFVSNMEHGFVPRHSRRQQVAEILQTTPEELWPGEYS